jgi:uncharacterized protein YndB with AHSA1/START domain
MTGKIEPRVVQRFNAPADWVYDTWLDPERARIWMAAALKSFGLSGDIQRVEIDARVGGKFFFSDNRDGIEARHWGQYLELVRPIKIVFTWIVDESEEANPSRVTLTIEPEPEGCVATIVHEMDEAWRDYISQTENGWSRMLQQIESLPGR